MTENLSGSPIFAGRYRFQTVGADWDTGRSGFTHLVFDIKKERLGVIKRADIKSLKAVEGLKNEVAALLDLRGQGVPEVYDTGEAEYGSKNYFYMVIEYIEGIRVEKHLDTLSVPERAEILTQFFRLLAKAHGMGIVNGDIDLKHLFWLRDKKQLVVIDWGNSSHNLNPRQKNEFAYDLARSAEIIYSLLTRKGHPPATGSLALPSESSLITGLYPVPVEFRNLCKWAPRTPSDGSQPPYTAQELLNASKKAWQGGIPPKPAKRPFRILYLLVVFGIIVAIFLGLSQYPELLSLLLSKTSTPTPSTIILATSTEAVERTETISPTETSLLPTSTFTAVVIPTSTSSPTITPSPVITPGPGIYSDSPYLLVFDNRLNINDCWKNETTSLLGLRSDDGFTRRTDGNWRFGIRNEYLPEDIVQTDFSQCIQDQQINAISLNAWVTRLELERISPDNPERIEPGKEFGFFLEDTNGQRREYTIWIDKEKLLHLQIRENGEIVYNEARAVLNKLTVTGEFPRSYAEFSLQIFLEINNQNLDIIYLQGGPTTQAPGSMNDIIPNEVIRMDGAVRPTLGTIQKIGLIGYGNDIQTLIWPLVFFGE